MSDSNRVQFSIVRETVLGTTPTTPRMRKSRISSGKVVVSPQYTHSGQIRPDRNASEPIESDVMVSAEVAWELAFPPDGSPESEYFRLGLHSDWVNAPARDNDGTAASVITGINATGGVVTVTTGDAFVAGHLARFTGFTAAANNGVFACTTGSATVPAFASAGLVADAAPAAAARMKAVGFVGASGDITATATGLASTTLDFTTLLLAVGQWIKIGGTAAGDRFATTALNAWVRLTAITANALTCDNLPTGWTTDTGTGKTIKVWFGDYIRNGVLETGISAEIGFLDQATPTYVVGRGLQGGDFSIAYNSGNPIQCSLTMTGLTGSQSTTALDATPDDAATNSPMGANIAVGRVNEGGSAIASPNFVRNLGVKISNNLRRQTGLGVAGAVGVGSGEATPTGTMDVLFGDNTVLQKMIDGTTSSINAPAAINSQAVFATLPQVKFAGDPPNAAGANQDVMVSANIMGWEDQTTGCGIQFDRIEYYE